MPDCSPTWPVRATASVRLRVPGVDQRDTVRILAFGRQLDARTVDTGRRTDDPDRVLSPDQVAGYLAKYATKSAGGTSVGDNAHVRQIRTTCRELAARATTANIERYVLMGKWVSMLGFRGHFASKSRRYSVTLGALRRARRRAQALIAQSRSEGRPIDLASLEADLLAEDDSRTTLVVGQWQYVGSGWATEGQRVLASCRGCSCTRVRPVESGTGEDPTGIPQGRQVEDKVMDGQIEDRLWSVQDVSDYLGVPVHTIYAWRTAGTGPPGVGSASVCATDPRTSGTGWLRFRPGRGMKPLGLGEHGHISITREGAAYTAYVRFRDYAGRGRRVKRSGSSKAAASRNVLRAVREALDADGDGDLGLTSTLEEASRPWLATFEGLVVRGARSPSTLDAVPLRRCPGRSSRGSARCGSGEVTTPRLDRFVQSVLVERGYATAKLSRSVLSGMCGWLVRRGVLAVNPVRDLTPLELDRDRTARAMSVEEMRELAHTARRRPRREATRPPRDGPVHARDRASSR